MPKAGEKMKDRNENGMIKLMRKLYPICRSITGNGVRQTLNIIKKQIPIKINNIKSGTKVFDWVIPKEWNIKNAYIKDSQGKKIIDYKKSNLHILNYSIPVNKKISFQQLKKHLFTLPEYPDWIPYLTSYYKENWGFCISHNQYKKLKNDVYQAVIDSSLKDGFLTYGELYLAGEQKEEVLFTCYVCHPSLCNDNLSGIVLLTYLAKQLLKVKHQYSYRFLFIPETIGAITWLSRNKKLIKYIKHGLVATCVGDVGCLTYKKTRDGNHIIDKVVEKVLLDSGKKYNIVDFFPYGSDERQFCSPGFNLPIGSLMRTLYGKFPEYHTSADNLSFISASKLKDSLEKYKEIIYVLENNKRYLNVNPQCEPQLGKRGLYRMLGSQKSDDLNEIAMLWILNMSDGHNTLLDIACRSGLSFRQIKSTSDILKDKQLLKLINE